jgi:transposase
MGYKNFKGMIIAYNTYHFINYLHDIIDDIKRSGIVCGVLVMDNVAFVRSEEVRNFIIRENFVCCFLPPYSPFLNLIKNLFSKVKN